MDVVKNVSGIELSLRNFQFSPTVFGHHYPLYVLIVPHFGTHYTVQHNATVDSVVIS